MWHLQICDPRRKMGENERSDAPVRGHGLVSDQRKARQQSILVSIDDRSEIGHSSAAI